MNPTSGSHTISERGRLWCWARAVEPGGHSSGCGGEEVRRLGFWRASASGLN
jgi:hypothetical protein